MLFSVITLTYNQLDDLQSVLLPALQRQTCQDFEWILASDGSTDRTKEWAEDTSIKIYHKEKNTGFDLTGCLNEAVTLAEGEYLVFIMGDSYPKTDFLEQVNKHVRRDTLFTGIRMDTDWETKEVIKPEWRTENKNINWFVEDPFILHGESSYAYMTLNSMIMNREDYIEMGGIPTEYSGYGMQDWYMALWSIYHDKQLAVIPRAILYHKYHKDRGDSKINEAAFEQHLAEFEEGKR